MPAFHSIVFKADLPLTASSGFGRLRPAAVHGGAHRPGSQAAGLAAQRRTPEQMDGITEALDALGQALNGGAASAQEGFAFHLTVAGASGNGMFTDILQLLGPHLRQAMAVALGITQAASRERGQRVFAEHQAVAEAIARGDAEGASLCMRFHLHRATARWAFR